MSKKEIKELKNMLFDLKEAVNQSDHDKKFFAWNKLEDYFVKKSGSIIVKS